MLTNVDNTKPQIGSDTQLRLDRIDLLTLGALNFIFLTDKDQTNCSRNYNDQQASQQAVHEIGQ
jgi:hypothetical protein